MDKKVKIYRVNFKDGTSKFVVAESVQGVQGLMGVYAQRVSPKRG